MVDPSGHFAQGVQGALGCAGAIIQQIGQAATALTTFVGHLVSNLVTFLTHIDYNTLLGALMTMAICYFPTGCFWLNLADWAFSTDLATGRHLSEDERWAHFKEALVWLGLDLLTWGVGWALGALFKGVEELVVKERFVADDMHEMESIDQAGAQAERDAVDGVPHDASGGDASAGDAGGGGGDSGSTGPCSFSPDTLAATPTGERAIGSLKVVDRVVAYNPSAGKVETEPIQHVWVNHDTDLVDVQLQTREASAASAKPSATDTGAATTGAPAPAVHRSGPRSGNRQQSVKRVVQAAVVGMAAALALLVGGGHQAALAAPAQQPSTTPATHAEIIHTTANHPWLTADHGWVPAGLLRPGEGVVSLDGATSTVAWVHVVPGQADMYNLTVANDHTYAVGDGQAVVHNIDGPGACGNGVPRTPDGKYAPRNGQLGRDGAVNEQIAWDHLEIDTNVGRGPTKVSAPGLRDRFYDGTVEIDGEWYGIETKGATAKRDPGQRAFDNWLNTPGNTVQTSDGRTLVGVFDVWVPEDPQILPEGPVLFPEEPALWK